MDNDVIWQADAVALADRVGELVTRIRCAEAKLGAVLVEIEDRGVGELFGYRSVARLLEELADVSADTAGKLVRRARALHPSQHLDGTTSPALAPATAAAALDGQLSNPTIDTIIQTVKQIPAEHRPDAEREMVTLAQNAGRRQVAALGTHLLGYLNPDGPAPDDTAPSVPERELSLRRKRTGIWELHGKFDDETGTRANVLLDSLAERRTSNDGPDLRSPQERYGDAFSDAVDLALNSPDLPMQAGERTHVLVTISLEDLKNGIGAAALDNNTSTANQTNTAAALSNHTKPGTARLGDSGEISAADARLLACDSSVIPAVLGSKSEPLDLGRLRRLITAGLRRALHLRDRGCAFPAVTGHRVTAKATMSGTGPKAAPPTSATWSCSAVTTTGCCTVPAGKSASPPTACPSSSRPPSSTDAENPGATTSTGHYHALPDHTQGDKVTPCRPERRRASTADRPQRRVQLRQVHHRPVPPGDPPGPVAHPRHRQPGRRDARIRHGHRLRRRW